MIKSLMMTLLGAGLLTGCLSLNQPIISEYTQTVETSHFQTYFISSNKALPNALAKLIESAIHIKMNALGYESSEILPDLEIHYEIYEDKFTTPYLIGGNSEDVSQHEKKKLKKIKLKHGSIYVSLFNKKNQYVVWRGFSDGHSSNPRIVKSLTYRIMDHYDVLASSENKIASR